MSLGIDQTTAIPRNQKPVIHVLQKGFLKSWPRFLIRTDFVHKSCTVGTEHVFVSPGRSFEELQLLLLLYRYSSCGCSSSFYQALKRR